MKLDDKHMIMKKKLNYHTLPTLHKFALLIIITVTSCLMSGCYNDKHRELHGIHGMLQA